MKGGRDALGPRKNGRYQPGSATDSASEEWMEIEAHPEIYRGYEWDYTWNSFGTKNCVLRVSFI